MKGGGVSSYQHAKEKLELCVWHWQGRVMNVRENQWMPGFEAQVSFEVLEFLIERPDESVMAL